MLLQGVKVIEHATYFAAPGAGGILSDWGAEVIKIEPPGGDPVRSNFPTKGTGKEHLTDNPAFDGDNRGKKSIVVGRPDRGGPRDRSASWPTRRTCSSPMCGRAASSGRGWGMTSCRSGTRSSSTAR